jgi:hypothetical protein
LGNGPRGRIQESFQADDQTKKGRDLFPVIVALRQWGEDYLFSRGEKRLQILDRGTRKPPRRLDVQNVRGDALTANGLELVTVTT